MKTWCFLGLSVGLLLAGCGEDHEGSTTGDAGGDATDRDSGADDANVMRETSTGDADLADGSADGSVPGTRITDALDAAVAAVCTFATDCVTDQTAGLLFLTQLDCERALPQVFPVGELRHAIEQVQAGNIEYNAVAFEACITRVREACIPIDGTFCPEAFEGPAAIDGDCASDYDCAGDAYCQTGRTCPGTCVERSAPGQPCSEARTCSSGDKEWAICDDTDTCRTAEVVSLGKEGDDCGVSAVGNNLGLSFCEPGLYCDLEGTKKCVAPATAGKDCTSNLCEPGTVCVGTDPALCVAPTLVKNEGGTCNGTTLLCDPQSGLACQTGKCALITDGAQGDICPANEFGGLFCGEGLICRQLEGARSHTCEALGVEGDPCESGSQCESGACYINECSAAFCSANAGSAG